MGPGSDRADVRTPWLCCEVKHRRHLPDWLTGALAQAVPYAGPSQTAIAVLHEHGRHIGDSLVVLRLADFADLCGEIPIPPDGGIAGE